MASESKKSDKKSRGPTPEEIINGFQALRIERRNLTSKLSEFELDLNEHKLVIETLKNVNEDRKCFRMVGGVLTERKVKDVLPVLITNTEKLTELIAKFNEQLVKKAEEINEYREKYNLNLCGQMGLKEEEQSAQEASKSRGNILVV